MLHANEKEFKTDRRTQFYDPIVALVGDVTLEQNN